MTDETARKVANMAMGLAVIVVLSRPPLRRLAWQLALMALTGTLPAWLNHEVRQAWTDSGRQMR